jgi:hypothetical protein
MKFPKLVSKLGLGFAVLMSSGNGVPSAFAQKAVVEPVKAEKKLSDLTLGEFAALYITTPESIESLFKIDDIGLEIQKWSRGTNVSVTLGTGYVPETKNLKKQYQVAKLCMEKYWYTLITEFKAREAYLWDIELVDSASFKVGMGMVIRTSKSGEDFNSEIVLGLSATVEECYNFALLKFLGKAQ